MSFDKFKIGRSYEREIEMVRWNRNVMRNYNETPGVEDGVSEKEWMKWF